MHEPARRRVFRVLLIAALWFPLLTAPGAAAQEIADPYQSSIDILKRATHPQRDGSHLPLLFALRELRDPDLKSLFLQLTQLGAEQHDWQMQVHAALGLAEIDPKKQVDPWMITQILPEAQEAVIATALDLKLMPQPAMNEILQWDQLQAMSRLFLLAERQTLNLPPDTAELTRLSKSDDSHVAAMASGLLAQNGQAGVMKAFDAQLAAKPADERLAVTMWLIDAARRYRLSALADWIAEKTAAADVDPDMAYRGTLTLLTIDSAKGLPAWERYLGNTPSFGHRVRCGTMLLASHAVLPAAEYDKLLPAAADEELVARIVDVGKAIAASTDPTDALIALLDIGQVKTGLWAMEYLKGLPPEQSRKVYEHLIDRMDKPRGEWTEGIAQSVEATSRLFEIDPEAVITRLRKAPDDGPLQQSILLGMFETTSPEAGVAATALPRIGSGRADSLALLLQAKHASTLTPEQLKQLGTIASGGGRVSEILQVQAAWLYLKHTNKIEPAMAAVFAK